MGGELAQQTIVAAMTWIVGRRPWGARPIAMIAKRHLLAEQRAQLGHSVRFGRAGHCRMARSRSQLNDKGEDRDPSDKR